MAKVNKVEVIDQESAPAFLSTKNKINAINSPGTDTKEETGKHPISLVVNPKVRVELETLRNRFIAKTEAYFSYPSKVQFFETGCYFLKQLFEKDGTYKIAPKPFIKYISRRGKRPSSDKHAERKANAKPLYLTIESKAYDIYFNLIYSFLAEADDINNEYYSSSYFLKDFNTLLKKNFKALCDYEKNNPRD